MIVKNTTGVTKSYGFANKHFVQLANGTSATISDDPDVVADAVAKANAGQLEIVGGPAASQMIGSGTAPDTIVLTINAGNGTGNGEDGDYFVIEGNVLEFDDDDSLANATAISVELGANAAVSGLNLVTAVNASSALATLGVAAVGSGLGNDTQTQVVLSYTGSAAFSTIDVLANGTDLTITKLTGAAGVTRRRFAVERTLANTTTDLIFVTDLESITSVRVTARVATTGVQRSLDGQVRVVGNVVFLDNSGSVDLAATDVVFLEAFGK